MVEQKSKEYTIFDACDIILGDYSKFVIESILQLKRPKFNMKKLQIIGKG